MTNKDAPTELLEPGAAAPDFSLSGVDRSEIRLSKFVARGPALVVFFKEACPTCQLTLPFVERLARPLRDGGISAVLGVSQDEAIETSRVRDALELTFPIALDEHPFRVSDAYRVCFVPTCYVVDTDMRIVLSDYGFSKSALLEAARILASDRGILVAPVFEEESRLPERLPGCGSKNQA